MQWCLRMPHYRKNKNHKVYAVHAEAAKKSGGCAFCELKADSYQVIKIAEHFKIIKNIFPYDNWDARDVLDHLMITPIMHTESLSTLGDEAAVEFVKLMSGYEKQGYDVYGRSPHSTVKSVPHQHTHLIKTGGKNHKAIIHLQKPYISITF